MSDVTEHDGFTQFEKAIRDGELEAEKQAEARAKRARAKEAAKAREKKKAAKPDGR